MKRYFMESFKKEKDSSTLSSFRGSDSDRRILTKSLNDRKKGFTFLVKHFRSNPLTAMLRSCLSRFSQTKFRNKVAYSYGFTLAETLITLTILGIVAAITIPALINRQQEAANRTKVKKAMSVYERAINQMLVYNDLQTEDAFKAWAKKDATENDYAELRSYFKIVEESTSSPNCRFKSADRIWWDFCGTNDSNIENPIIILDEKLNGESRAILEADSKIENDENRKKLYVYALVGRRDAVTGSVRVNDKAYEDAQNNNATYQQEMEKLYAFIEKRAMVELTVQDKFLKGYYNKPCENPNGSYISCNNCKSCYINNNNERSFYDENGKPIAQLSWCDRNKDSFETCTNNARVYNYYNSNSDFLYNTCNLANITDINDINDNACSTTYKIGINSSNMDSSKYYSNGQWNSNWKNNCGGNYCSTISLLGWPPYQIEISCQSNAKLDIVDGEYKCVKK